MQKMIRVPIDDFSTLTAVQWGLLELSRIYDDIQHLKKQLNENNIHVDNRSLIEIHAGLTEIGQHLKDTSNEIIDKYNQAETDRILEKIRGNL